MSSEEMSPAGQDAPAPPSHELRKVTDARTLRALAHPVRIALLEALSISGAMTATQVGEQIGESPTTCSFHLRQLAKYGFVEEAGGGRGRARPWRMTSRGLSLNPAHGDTESEIAADRVWRLFRERAFARWEAWRQTRASYSRAWREAADDSEYVLWVTADELHQLSQELRELLRPRFRERATDPSKRPAGALPVEFLLSSYPIGPPHAEDDDHPPADGNT